MSTTTTPAMPDRSVMSADRSSEQILRVSALVIAAIAFALYPMLRGSAPETGLSGAELYARPAWLLAHCLGMAGFISAS